MRVQLALNVENLDESIEFYSKMFNTEPYKTKPGYANFAIEQPPLKLVLFERPGHGGSLNHLGVEVETADQVEAAEARIVGRGLQTTGVDDTLCCYAAKTETWVQGPDTRWEWYVKTDDVEAANISDVPDCECEVPEATVPDTTDAAVATEAPSAQPVATAAAMAQDGGSGGCCP